MKVSRLQIKAFHFRIEASHYQNAEPRSVVGRVAFLVVLKVVGNGLIDWYLARD